MLWFQFHFSLPAIYFPFQVLKFVVGWLTKRTILRKLRLDKQTRLVKNSRERKFFLCRPNFFFSPQLHNELAYMYFSAEKISRDD